MNIIPMQENALSRKRRKGNRPGRPAERAAGKAKPADQSQTLVRERRTDLHGMPGIGTEYPLDVLAARGLLGQDGQELADKGAELMRLHGACIGRGLPAAGQLWRSAPSGKEGDPPPVRSGPPDDEAARARYEAMRASLRACGAIVEWTVVQVAVYRHPIAALLRHPSKQRRALAMLIQGLEALRAMRRPAARKEAA